MTEEQDNIIRIDIREFLTEEYNKVMDYKDKEIQRLKIELERLEKREIILKTQIETSFDLKKRYEHLTQILEQLTEKLDRRKEPNIQYLLLFKTTIKEFPSKDYDYTCNVSYHIYDTITTAILEEKKYKDKFIETRKNMPYESQVAYKIETLIIPFLYADIIGNSEIGDFIKERYIEILQCINE